MYNVLLAVDADETRAERSANAIVDLPADPSSIDVVLLNVFKEFEVTDGEGRVDSSELYDEGAFPDSVTKATEILDAAGIDATKRREHGNPAELILEVAEEIDANLVAVGGRKRSPTGKVIFGSVTLSVLQEADTPVLVTMSE